MTGILKECQWPTPLASHVLAHSKCGLELATPFSAETIAKVKGVFYKESSPFYFLALKKKANYQGENCRMEWSRQLKTEHVSLDCT